MFATDGQREPPNRRALYEMVSIRRPRITPDKTSVSVAYLSIPDLAAQNRFRTVKTYSPIHYLNSNYSPKYGLNVLNYMLIALQ